MATHESFDVNWDIEKNLVQESKALPIIRKSRYPLMWHIPDHVMIPLLQD